MKGEKFINSTPSHRVNARGYRLMSRVKRIVASAVTYRLTLLFSSIAPVRNSPFGTTTRPPPLRTQAAIAVRNAPVLSVALLPTAPNAVTLNSRDGNVGG